MRFSIVHRFRRKYVGVASLTVIVALLALPIVLPPDGQERTGWVQLIGHFHPLAVHLPIAFVLLVPVLEVAGRCRRFSGSRRVAGFVLGLTLLSALVAPAFGWCLAWSGGYSGRLLTQHMWGGVGLTVSCWLCWALRRQLASRARHSARVALLYPFALSASVLLVVWTGYRGGQLAHGEDHLIKAIPASVRIWMGPPAPGEGTSASDIASETSTFFAARIQPVLAEHCVTCHGPSKHKAGLRLDSYGTLMAGGESGPVIKAGDPEGSDLLHRIMLPPTHEDFMPAEGRRPVSAYEATVIELWITAGASEAVGVNAIAGVKPMTMPAKRLAPDYRPEARDIAALTSSLGIRLVPRSQNPTEGLTLRTASAPENCNDDTLVRLAPVAPFIVDAELARTEITDTGLAALASFRNLRTLDLSHTAITSDGLALLTPLTKLETLNLTATAVDGTGMERLRSNQTLKHVYFFETNVEQPIDNAGK